MMATDEIRKDLIGDYGKRRGWACVAWKDREVEGHFEQKFFQWPHQQEEAIALVHKKTDEGCCVWKPTALLKEARRTEALPSNILSFEIDELTDMGRRLLGNLDCTILKSGRPKHYHVKIYLDQDLPHDDNAYWSKYFASACGITGSADSGGKFNPHDLLRIAGTRNTKPDVMREVTYRRRVDQKLPFRALRRKLKDFPAPNASTLALHNIDRIPIPEEVEIPRAVRTRLKEEAGEDRSEQTYAFVQLCKEEGLPPGYIVELAMDHKPTAERNNHNEKRIMEDVVRCWNKGNRTALEVEDAIFATPELQFLYREAKLRRACPTAALGTALIHAGLCVPPWFMLPPIIGGGKGTGVNLIVAMTGPSGAGKGVAWAPILRVPDSYMIEGETEDDVMSQPFTDAAEPREPSSGPAFAALFVEMQAAPQDEGKRKVGRPRKDELVQIAYARHIHWDEVDTLNTYLTDSRNAVSSLLRSAWSGKRLGTDTKGMDGRLNVKADKYRLMASFDAQPERAGDLFKQSAGGLLQRVLFLNAWDKHRERRELGRLPVERPMRLPKKWPKGGFTVDLDVWQIIDENHYQNRYVGTEASHKDTLQLRVAALLAVMHGSTRVEMGWWEIAGAIMEHSDQVKAEVRKVLRDAEREVQRSIGVKTAVQTVSRDAAVQKIKERTEARILTLLREASEPVQKSKIKARCSRYQMGVFYEVLEEMIKAKTIVERGARISLK